MTVIDGYRIEPLTPDRFDDFVTVIGVGGIGGCWCMYWTCPSTKAWREGAAGGRHARNRDAFGDIVDAGPPPGLVAYEEEEPVAWCRVMPRTALPGLANSRYFATDLDIDGVWSLPCFVVRRPWRARGLTGVLVRGAIDFARRHGATTLEAYPWDTDDTKDASVVYTGLASTFRRLGFDVVQRRAEHKPMMRISLA